jgi:hypothetical protein
MEMQSLHDLVERIAIKEDIALIVSALERFEIQSEIRLTEKTATKATHRAVDYMEGGRKSFSAQDNSLSRQRQLIAEHLQGRY